MLFINVSKLPICLNRDLMKKGLRLCLGYRVVARYVFESRPYEEGIKTSRMDCAVRSSFGLNRDLMKKGLRHRVIREKRSSC